MTGIQSGVADKFSDQIDLLQQAVTEQQKYRVQVDKTKEAAQGMADDMTDGFFGPIESGLAKIPILGKAMTGMLDGPKKAIKEAIGNQLIGGLSKAGTSGATMFGGLTKGATMFGVTLGVATAGITIAIGAIVAAFAWLWSLGMEVSKTQTEISKTMGISSEKAKEIYDNETKRAQALKSTLFTSKEMRQTMIDMNKDQAISREYTADQLQAHLNLTKYMGMEVSEATALNKSMMAQGSNATNLLDDVYSMTVAYNDIHDVNVNFREVTKAIAKTSMSVRSNFGGMGKELIAATIHASALGTTLEEMKTAGQGLLSIESSIASEMEARVLLGRNINMDQARSLAFQGKWAELGDEILKQAGTFEEISDLLPHQQEALAKAAGVSLDRLLEMTEAAELNKMLGKDALGNAIDLKKISAEDLALKIEQLKSDGKLSTSQEKRMLNSVQQRDDASKMADTMKILTELLTGPLTSVAKKMTGFFAGLTEHATTLSVIFEVIKFALGMAFAPLIGAYNIIDGIVGLFGGNDDSMLSNIGKIAIGVLSIIPGFGMIGRLIKPIGKFLGKLVPSLSKMGPALMKAFVGPFKWIQSKISKLIPAKLMKWLGIGAQAVQAGGGVDAISKVTNETPEGTNSTTTEPTAEPINEVDAKDFTINTHEKDTIAVGGTLIGSEIEKQLVENNRLLQLIVDQVSEPTLLEFGDGIVQKIANRSGFLTKIGANLGLG